MAYIITLVLLSLIGFAIGIYQEAKEGMGKLNKKIAAKNKNYEK